MLVVSPDNIICHLARKKCFERRINHNSPNSILSFCIELLRKEERSITLEVYNVTMMKVATTLLSSLPSRLLSAGVFLLFIFVFVSCCSFVKTTAVRSRSTTRPQRRQTNTAQHVPAKASRIVGGEKSNRNRFPYFALMNGDTACGAVLISKRFILTAAHCRDADLNFVIGGGSNNDGNDNNNYNNTNQETSSSSSSHFYIDKIIHPMYDPITFSNDIALFQLQQDYDNNIVITGDGDNNNNNNNNNNSSSIVGHNDDVPYVRLSSEIIEKVGTEMTVIGFGTTTTGNNNNNNDLDNDNNNNTKILYAEDLHQVDVYYVSTPVCNRIHRGVLYDHMMCANVPNKSPCYGDSGGPLLLTPNNNYHDDVLVGIVSWGRGCADDYPIVYTRISYFYDWIVETMCVLNATGVPDYVNCDDIVIDVDIDDDDDFNFNIDYNESLSISSSIDNDINNGTIVTETVVVAVVDDNNNDTSLSSSWDSIDDNANDNANDDTNDDDDDDEEYITLIEIFTAENNNNNKKMTTTTTRDEKDRQRQIGNIFDDTTHVP